MIPLPATAAIRAVLAGLLIASGPIEAATSGSNTVLLVIGIGSIIGGIITTTVTGIFSLAAIRANQEGRESRKEAKLQEEIDELREKLAAHDDTAGPDRPAPQQRKARRAPTTKR